MLKYWHETLKGLESLAWDAFDAVCVTAGEKALAWWDRRNPNAHDIDMSGADYLADVEGEQEVWEPAVSEPPNMYAVLGSIVYAAELLADAVEHIETHLKTMEKQS